jgi:putative transposase
MYIPGFQPSFGHRQSIRLPRGDYSGIGAYFVTLCSHQRQYVFGSVNNGHPSLTALGEIVMRCWLAIPEHFSHVSPHDYVVMPNHLHGIMEITRSPVHVGARHCRALSGVSALKVEPGSLGTIIGSFKAIVTRLARKELGWDGSGWQRNYYERILRSGREYADACRYIAENPRQWEFDRENPQRVEG